MQHRADPAGSAPVPPLPPEVFERRRETVLSALGDGILVAQAAPELIGSRTTEVPYRQASDLHYLTGFPEPESVAVLAPFDDEHRFTLFVRERDPEREAWNGARIGVAAARERYGATAAYPIGELDERLPALLAKASHIVYPVGHDDLMDQRMLAALTRARLARQRTGVGPTEIVELESVLGPMRVIKGPEEIERMRVAARISAAGHLAAMRAARPGVGEWELQAILEATFRSLSGSGPAYQTIVGSGANATVLHYVSNERRSGPDDLVLIDAGAAYGLYCGDITRTFPVSGRFTEPQRALYDLVLAAEEAAIAEATPGNRFTAIHDAAVRVLTEGMLRLGLLRHLELEEAIETKVFRRFFMHQTSHFIGLDVHDVGLYHDGIHPVVIAPGMVLTIEPGLYVAADADDVPAELRGIGIRIEDDVLVTEAGPEILTRGVPVDPEAIERLIRGV